MPVFNLVNQDLDSTKILRPITADHFGGNYLLTYDSSATNASAGLGASIASLGLTSLRYPGGGVTEDFFSMTSPNSPGPGLIGQASFFSYAAQIGAGANLVLPTKMAFTKAAGTALLDGTYGLRTVKASYGDEVYQYVLNTLAQARQAGVPVKSIEIGNEFWLSGQMTSTEYGKVAAVALQAAHNAIQQAISLGYVTSAAQPDLLVQSMHATGLYSPVGINGATVYVSPDGLTVSRDAVAGYTAVTIASQGTVNQQVDKIVAAVKPYAALIDGVVDHIYEQDGFANVDGAAGVYTQFGRFESGLGRTAGSLDRYITEWNVKTGSVPNNSPAEVPSMMIEMFYEHVTHGATAANVWPLYFQTTGGTALISGSAYSVTPAGAMFRLMSESLRGKTALFDSNVVSGGIELDTHAFSNAGSFVLFTSNRSAVTANDVVLSLNDAGIAATLNANSYFIVATELGLTATGGALVTYSNGTTGTGNQIAFTGLAALENIRIEITYLTAGADVITGRNGNDFIAGSGGNDTAYGGIGLDSVNGGDGLDLLYGGDGNDAINGDAANDRLFGDAGNDVIYGGNGDNDQLFGGSGDDSLGGGTGNDSLYGGDGIDTAVFFGSIAATVNLSLATSQVTGFGTDLLSGIENVTSGTAADRLTGSSIANRLDAGAGNDTLDGQDGADVLLGRDGADSILGGTGADSITGGAGADILAGGAGDDRFIFNSTADFGDRVTDFTNVAGNDDAFAFSTSIGGGLVSGVLAASQFVTSTSNLAGDADDRFLFRTTDRTLWFDADGTGAAAALQVAVLTVGTLTSQDILIL